MVEANGNGNGDKITLYTPFGRVSAAGTAVFIVVALFGLTMIGAWEMSRRQAEHEQLACLIKLNLFMQTVPREKTITWHSIPQEYWRCMPSHLVDDARRVRPE